MRSLLLLLLELTNGTAKAQQADLTQGSLEDLMNVEVTSVSKKEQKISQTASAIFCDHARGYSPIRRGKHSRFSAHGAGARCGTDKRKHLGDQLSRLEWAIQQRAAGDG